MKNWKRVGIIALSLIIVIMLLPFGSFKVLADEEEEKTFEIENVNDDEKSLKKAKNLPIDFNTKTGVVKFYATAGLDYTIRLSYAKSQITIPVKESQEIEFDIKELLFSAGNESNTYTLYVYSNDEQNYGELNAVEMSDKITFNYPNAILYVEQPKLTILNYPNGKQLLKIEWNAVEHASYYQLRQYRDNGDTAYEYSANKDSTIIRYWDPEYHKGHDYQFVIAAVSEDMTLYRHGLSEKSYYVHVDDNGKMTMDEKPSPVMPTGIQLNYSSTTIYCGNELMLTAKLSPSNVTEKTLTWTSSNPTVATVNNGLVKAKSAGKTTVTAKTVNGLTAACNITVFADNVPGNIFADIKADSWMYSPAKSVYDKGYMTGTGTLDGRVLFSPNTDMNRTMFVQALYSMDGKPAVTYVQKFSDVKEGAWYAKAVTWASNNGVVAGNPDGTFGINGKATREQLALMFYKYAVSKGFDVTVKPSTTLDGFTDSKKVDSWALTAVKWAVERGIISGKGNASTGYRIAPTEKATRVECAAMMNKFSEIYANAPKMGIEDLEEPLALPEEEIEDLPVPADETEDVIIDEEEEDEDVPSEDEKETDEAESDSEEEAETDTE